MTGKEPKEKPAGSGVRGLILIRLLLLCLYGAALSGTIPIAASIFYGYAPWGLFFVGIFLFVPFCIPWLDLCYIAALSFPQSLIVSTFKFFAVPLCVGAVASFIGGLTVVQMTDDIGFGIALAAGFGLILLSAICGFVGFGLFRVGSRLRVPSAEQWIRVDERSPLLYLRSFGEDSTATRVEDPHPINPIFRPSDEQLMVRALRRFGPVIAVADPTQRWPALGVPRLQLDSEAWMKQVMVLVQACRLIMIRPGDTAGLGLRWEIFWTTMMARIQKFDFRKLVIIVGDNKSAYDDFRKFSKAFFPRPLPEYQQEKNWDGNIQGFVLFDCDGNAEFVSFRNGWKPIMDMLNAFDQD